MIYLLGGSGYVGQEYVRVLSERGIAFQNFTRRDLNYSDESKLTELLRGGRPDFLINAAGYTGKPNVDACELHKGECLMGNAVLPGVVARACATVGVPWGHISSGCIYTGARPDGTGFTEADPPNFTFRTNNCSFYSGTKALGEEVLADFPEAYVWRLRIPFDHRESPRNYLTKVMRYPRLLEAANSISELSEFVAATLACWEKQVPFGIYNVTNPGDITTREVVELIQQSGKCAKKEFSYFASDEEFMRIAAKTPRSNCLMDSSKLASTGIHLTEVRKAVTRALENWRSE